MFLGDRWDAKIQNMLTDQDKGFRGNVEISGNLR